MWVSRKEGMWNTRSIVASADFRNLRRATFRKKTHTKNTEWNMTGISAGISPHTERKSQQTRLCVISMNKLNNCITSFRLFLLINSVLRRKRWRPLAAETARNDPPLHEQAICNIFTLSQALLFRIPHKRWHITWFFCNPLIMRTNPLVHIQRDLLIYDRGTWSKGFKAEECAFALLSLLLAR
jgi:hypothetical protein